MRQDGALSSVMWKEPNASTGVGYPKQMLALFWVINSSLLAFSAQLSPEQLEEPDSAKVDVRKLQALEGAYSSALQATPDLPGLNLQFGIRLWQLGETVESKRAFQRELEINPGGPRPRVMLAIIKVQQHQYAEAAGELQALIQTDPSLTQIWHPLGRALFELGRFEEAKQCLENAAAADPGVAQVQALLAKTYAHLSDTRAAERASALYREALKVQSARDSAGLNRWQEALQLISEYLTAFPLSSDGLYVKAGILFNGFRDLDSAIQTARDSIHQKPSNLEARNLLAALFLAKRDFQAFEYEVGTILQMDPLDGRANYYLGRLEYDRSLFAKARGHLERARLVQPNNALVVTALARTYEKLGLNRQAEEGYKKGIELGRSEPGDGTVYSYYAAFLLNQRRATEAVQYFDQAVASPATRSETWYLAGVAHLENGDLAQAKRCLQKAVEQRPNYAAAHSALGTVLQKQGDIKSALREFALGREGGDNAKPSETNDAVVQDLSLPQ
jgi:Tfp pilus assembly protein PilF